MFRILALCPFLFLLACSPVKEQVSLPASDPDDNKFTIVNQRNDLGTVREKEEINPCMTLQYQLLSIPGVTLSGGTVVTRGGENGLGGTTAPLYVVDGVVVGGFHEAERMVWPPTIDKIRVLKGGAAAVYGTRAQRTGVIVIETKTVK